MILDSKHFGIGNIFQDLILSPVLLCIPRKKGCVAHGIKPRRRAKGLHAVLHGRRARYSDILISGVFLLTTSSPLLSRDTHPLFRGIYYPLSRSQPASRATRRKHPGETTLPGIRQFPRRHGATVFPRETPDCGEVLISSWGL